MLKLLPILFLAGCCAFQSDRQYLLNKAGYYEWVRNYPEEVAPENPDEILKKESGNCSWL